MDYSLTQKKLKEMLDGKLLHYYSQTVETATYENVYRALAMILKDMLMDGRVEFKRREREQNAKRCYYLSMEFLPGRSMKNILYALGLEDVFAKTLKSAGLSLDRIYDCEPDANLGNGGLGRLASCYIDSMANRSYSAIGYSILYEYGIFKQKIAENKQTTMPDTWLPGGEVWLAKKEDGIFEVRFEGSVYESWDNGMHSIEHRDYVPIKAIPYDMYIPGKGGKAVNVLRLWTSQADSGPVLDLFNSGEFVRANERLAMAKAVSQILYPGDNNPEGKALRLRQQYFLVSASVQDIIHRHLKRNPTLANLPDKVAIHINDTHPSLAIPEFMRILLDECGYDWEGAWSLVGKCFAYTNHTVMSEALESWSCEVMERLLPRIYMILREIDNRQRAYVWDKTHDAGLVERTAVISGGFVHMANLDVAACHSVNGVSELHSRILTDQLFSDFYKLEPEKFTNVTNGITYRRWLGQDNPGLCGLIESLIGKKFLTDASALEGLKKYTDDKAVLSKVIDIKKENKRRLAEFVKRTQGVELDPDSIFDVQAKRLHEYKRQTLNILNIIDKYLTIKDDPNGNYTPHTYIFSAKAAPSYDIALRIINLICSLSELINNDPDVNRFLKVVFIENYCVTVAETLLPAADFSEQISLAGKEASGTSNMKLMINGAVTIGTLDGANIEIAEAVGDDNIIIFGMNRSEVEDLRFNGYRPQDLYANNPALHRALDFMRTADIAGANFADVASYLINSDPYMALADFAEYKMAQEKAEALYSDPERFAGCSLMNTAMAGRFSGDRSVTEYADNIWHMKPVK
ncbi:MAG: glycogen/starch/alpha-glucan phosphorylase [Clostridia bacterium]|nr:glycogen/starch/alpha-glucan phosphorylase [Clostridia bacterium]